MFSAKPRAMDHGPWLEPQERGGGSCSAPSRYQARGTTYDIESGQVYIEKTVRASKKQKVNWIHQYKTPSLVRGRHANKAGAASLFDMAKAKVARETPNLTASHLEVLPSSVGRKLWDEVEDSRLETFHTWRIFVSAYSESFKSPYRRYFLDIKEPALPLADYLTSLDSTSMKWLTCLRIAPQSIDRSDLVRIAQLQNIAVLDLSDDISLHNLGMQIDERIFKTWAEMAGEGKAFKHVRVILMRGQADVSAWIFKYLDNFPSLCFLVLSDCRLIHQKNRAEWTDQAASSGWEARHAKKSARSLKTLIDDKNFYLGSVSGCYYHSKETSDQLATRKKSKIADSLPVVEVWIGRPKPWIHLIEEFPGTRTVWFDNSKTKDAARNAKAGRKTEAPAIARVPTVALPERIKTPQPEECTKRTRDMLSSPGSDTMSPPHKRTTTMLRSRMKNIDQIMAEVG